jgi:hypothetical protein
VLHYTELEVPAKKKHSSLLGQFVSYNDKKVLWIWLQGPNYETIRIQNFTIYIESYCPCNYKSLSLAWTNTLAYYVIRTLQDSNIS